MHEIAPGGRDRCATCVNFLDGCERFRRGVALVDPRIREIQDSAVRGGQSDINREPRVSARR
jgi:hypothetical protein